MSRGTPLTQIANWRVGALAGPWVGAPADSSAGAPAAPGAFRCQRCAGEGARAPAVLNPCAGGSARWRDDRRALR
jgi:hypothetical protein